MREIVSARTASRSCVAAVATGICVAQKTALIFDCSSWFVVLVIGYAQALSVADANAKRVSLFARVVATSLKHVAEDKFESLLLSFAKRVRKSASNVL